MDEVTTQPPSTPSPNKSTGLWIGTIILLVILAAGAFYFLFAKKGPNQAVQTVTQSPSPTVTQQTTPAPTSSTSATPTISQTATAHMVTLMTNGFSPATLTIKAGETVTWINNSGESATVNSDPHPTHTDYPPLNLGPFANGGKLSLMFPKAGTYGYHNHVNPSERGTIIVQ